MKWRQKELEIRYADTDRMGVIHHGVYPLYCEVGRTWYCEASGIPYAEMEKEGMYMMVADMQCRFKAPATYGDKLTVSTAISTLSRRLIIFDYEIHKEGLSSPVFTAQTKMVVADRNYRTVSMPRHIFDILQAGQN